MQKSTVTFLLIIGLLLTAPVCAEIYKYIDENGQKRWTDDLSQIPKEQRPSAQRIETIEGTPADADTEEGASTYDTLNSAASAQEQSDTDKLSREVLEKEKGELDALYQQLLEERKELEQIKAVAISAKDRAEMNDKISAYNNKTERYETRLNAFNEKIKAYNQKVTSKQAPAKGKP